jgi:hypothetical protein
MRLKTIATLLLTILFVLALALRFLRECAYGGGIGAAYKSCDCLGIEWELYDHTAADGPRKTICIGIVRSIDCYQYMGGPPVECNGR